MRTWRLHQEHGDVWGITRAMMEAWWFPGVAESSLMNGAPRRGALALCSGTVTAYLHFIKERPRWRALFSCANRTLQRPAVPTAVSRQRRDGVGWAAPDPHQFIWLEAFVPRGKKTNKWRREAAGRAFLPAVTLYYSTVTWGGCVYVCIHAAVFPLKGWSAEG